MPTKPPLVTQTMNKHHYWRCLSQKSVGAWALMLMLELCTRLTKPTNWRPNLSQCTGTYLLCAEISPVNWTDRRVDHTYHLCADHHQNSLIYPTNYRPKLSPWIISSLCRNLTCHLVPQIDACIISYFCISPPEFFICRPQQDHRSEGAHFFLLAVGL